MFRTVPFNIRENAERGREVLEKALEFAAEQPFNPLGESVVRCLLSVSMWLTKKLHMTSLLNCQILQSRLPSLMTITTT